jgi:ABC-2 type transport system permease protein
MSSKSKRNQSFVRLGIFIAIVLILNYVASFFIFRADLTAEKRFTLTPTTKELLKKLDDVVYVKVFLEGDELPVGFKHLRNSVKEMLEEFKVFAHDKVMYEFTEPTTSDDAKERQNVYNELAYRGLQTIEIKEKQRKGKNAQTFVVPGVLIRYKDNEIAINVLKNNPNVSAEQNLNNSTQTLEYELTNGFRKLIIENPRTIGFTQSNGELDNAHLQQFTNTLSEYYRVERTSIPLTADSLRKFSVLIIAKPTKAFTEQQKFVLDQFIMHGGKAMFLIDAVSISLDSLAKPKGTIAIPFQHQLEDQLFTYGARINPVLVKDLNCSPISLAINNSNGQPGMKQFPYYFAPVILTTNSHTINRYINAVRTEFVSSIDTVSANPQVKKTVLLASSKHTQVQVLPAQVSIGEFTRPIDMKEFSHKPATLAVLMEGRFPSVFQDRPIDKFAHGTLAAKMESQPTKIIVVADGDIIRNSIAPTGETYPLGFDRNSQKVYGGNKEFLLNAINYLCDDEGLMAIRNREIKLRLLDKAKIAEDGGFWQAFNVVLPVLLVVIFGLAAVVYRKKRYAK